MLARSFSKDIFSHVTIATTRVGGVKLVGMFGFNTSAGKPSVRHGESRRKKRPNTDSKSRKLCDDTEAAVPGWVQSVSVEDTLSRERACRLSSRNTRADEKLLEAQVGVAVTDAAVARSATQSFSSAGGTKENGDVSARVVGVEGALQNVDRRLEEVVVALDRLNEENMRL
jgi:hypothetical protein